MLTFTPITLEHHALLRKYYAGCDYHLCEYSAGTKLMWSLYLRPSFAEEAGCLIVRNRIDGEWVFDYPVPGPDGDVDAALTAIESYCTDTETPLVISVVPEEKAGDRVALPHMMADRVQSPLGAAATLPVQLAVPTSMSVSPSEATILLKLALRAAPP